MRIYYPPSLRFARRGILLIVAIIALDCSPSTMLWMLRMLMWNVGRGGGLNWRVQKPSLQPILRPASSHHPPASRFHPQPQFSPPQCCSCRILYHRRRCRSRFPPPLVQAYPVFCIARNLRTTSFAALVEWVSGGVPFWFRTSSSWIASSKVSSF